MHADYAGSASWRFAECMLPMQVSASWRLAECMLTMQVSASWRFAECMLTMQISASWRFAECMLTMQVSAGYRSVLIQRGSQGTVQCGGHAQRPGSSVQGAHPEPGRGAQQCSAGGAVSGSCPA